MKRIMVVAGDAGGANALVPVIHSLEKRGTATIDLYAYNQANRYWKDKRKTRHC